MSLLLWRLILFHLDAMRVRVSVMANASDLPGNFAARRPTSDLEPITCNFPCDVEVWLWPANRRQLITKISIQRLEVVGHCDPCRAARIERDHAVIDVHHVGRFDKGVVQVLIFRIEGMV